MTFKSIFVILYMKTKRRNIEMETKNIKTIEISEPSVVISKEEYESLKETLEILSDNDLLKEISEALSEKKEDRVEHEKLFGN